MAEKGKFWTSGFGSFLNNMLYGLPGVIAGLIGSSRLTGAEREQNAFNAQQASVQRDYEAEQASLNRQFQSQQVGQQLAFQREMAGSQYQRAVSDMQAAGVNPALAMSNGGNVAPSGASASGSAASGVAAAGSGRGLPFSMSEIMQALRMRKEMRVLDEQAKNIAADTKDKEASAAERGQRLEWNPQIWSSEIRLREKTEEKLTAEVRSILATAEGQEIYNNFSPSLFESQLQTAEVNRSQMIASIARMQSEIEHMAYQNAGIRADIEYKRALQILTAAQTSLVNLQASSVSLDVWSKDFEKTFREEFGFEPDQPIWNNVGGLLGKFARVLDQGRQNTWNFVGSLFKKK